MNGNCLDGAIPVGKASFLARQDLFFCSGRNRVADWTARGYARGDYGRQGFSRPAGPQTEAAYLVDPLGVQLPRRLTEKVPQESVTSEPNNSS